MPLALRPSPLEIRNASLLAISTILEHRPSELQSAPGMVSVETTYSYRAPMSFRQPFAKYVLSSGGISQQTPPLLATIHRMVWYSQAPKPNVSRLRSPALAKFSREGKSTIWPSTYPTLRVQPTSPPGSAWSITRNTVLGKMRCNDTQAYTRDYLYEHGSGEFLIETTKTNCSEHCVWYNTNISYTRGVRSIIYTTRDMEPQP